MSTDDSGVSDNSFSGLACLCILAGYHQQAAQPLPLAKVLGLNPDAISLNDIRRATLELGLVARVRRVDPARAQRLPTPFILILDDGSYAVLLRTLPDSRHLVLFPPEREPQALTTEELGSRWSGQALLIKRPLTLREVRADSIGNGFCRYCGSFALH